MSNPIEPGDLREQVLWQTEGLEVWTWESVSSPHGWRTRFASDWAVSLFRSGSMMRRGSGFEQVVDRTMGAFRQRGDEYEAAEPSQQHKTGTLICVDPEHYGELVAVPTRPIRITPSIDLRHRMLLKYLLQRDGSNEVENVLIDLLHDIVTQETPTAIRYSRRTTGESRRRLVRQACERLQDSRFVTLRDLAATVGTSPFHLSRLFREVMGCTIPQYRLQLNVSDALDRLGTGDDDLASVAVDAGFSDHSHMTRTFVTMLGATPSRVRSALSPAPR